jgi:hypothetical protein
VENNYAVAAGMPAVLRPGQVPAPSYSRAKLLARGESQPAGLALGPNSNKEARDTLAEASKYRLPAGMIDREEEATFFTANGWRHSPKSQSQYHRRDDMASGTLDNQVAGVYKDITRERVERDEAQTYPAEAGAPDQESQRIIRKSLEERVHRALGSKTAALLRHRAERISGAGAAGGADDEWEPGCGTRGLSSSRHGPPVTHPQARSDTYLRHEPVDTVLVRRTSTNYSQL